MEQPVGEIKHLQGCLNDLISILALPAIWSGYGSAQIVSTLLDVLLGILRLDFAYVQLSHTIYGSPTEVVRLAQGRNVTPPQEVVRVLNCWLAGDPPASSCRVPNPLGEGEMSIAPLRLGLHNEVGVFVAGSRRPDFPTKTEMLLLQVAANQAAIGLQEARPLTEQRRAAEEISFQAGLLDAVDQAVVATDSNGVITYWNRFAAQLYGWSAPEVIGHNLLDLNLVLGSPRAAAGMLSRGQRGQRWTRECLAQHRDGTIFPALMTDSPIDNSQGMRIGVVRVSIDITAHKRAEEEIARRVGERTRQLTAVNDRLRQEVIERQRSEQRLAMQYAITRVLAESNSFADAMPHLLQAIGESMAWEWGALWNTDRDAGVLRCESIWHAPNVETAELDAISRETAGMTGPSLKGHVWQSAEPAWIADATKDPTFMRAPIAASVGLHGAIAFPILLRGETIGVMEFFSRTVRQPDEEDFKSLSAIGSQIGQFVERKRVEEEHRKLALLVENSPDFIGIASPDGQVLFVNPSGQQMVGIEGNEQVRAIRMLDYVMEQERERVEQQVLPALMRDGRWKGETQFRHFQTGAAIPMQHHSFLIKEPGSHLPVALATISRDISERKWADVALRESQERYRLLVEGVKDYAIIMLDVEGRITSWNTGAERIKGYLAEEIVGEHFSRFYPAEDVGRGKPELELKVAAEEGRCEYEGWRVRKNGTRFFANIVITALRDEAGHLRGFAKVTRNITERKQAEEALHTAQAELAHATRVLTMGELTASIAHEVNQPLTAVINNSNACLRWLARETPDLEALREALRDIITNGQRASDVITRIRMALKKAPTPVVPLDINEVIEEVVGLTHHEVQQHGVQLHTELAANLPHISGDRVQIQQVLLNLLMNSIEAMSTVMNRPRQLLICSGRAGSDNILVAVQDSGIGLDSQTLERMFDAFYTTKSTGMGMGLSISRTIIKAHGGQLWAEPSSGHGATFQFILPNTGENQHD
jgi:PAS domain S-box-containing protein